MRFLVKIRQSGGKCINLGLFLLHRWGIMAIFWCKVGKFSQIPPFLLSVTGQNSHHICKFSSKSKTPNNVECLKLYTINQSSTISASI